MTGALALSVCSVLYTSHIFVCRYMGMLLEGIGDIDMTALLLFKNTEMSASHTLASFTYMLTNFC